MAWLPCWGGLSTKSELRRMCQSGTNQSITTVYLAALTLSLTSKTTSMFVLPGSTTMLTSKVFEFQGNIQPLYDQSINFVAVLKVEEIKIWSSGTFAAYEPSSHGRNAAMISESAGGAKKSMTHRVRPTKVGIPDGNDTPAPQRNTTRPALQRFKRASDIVGPSTWNFISLIYRY